MFRLFADTSTSILKGVSDIDGLLALVVRVLSYGLGAAAVIGVVVAGIMYLTARDNESQVAAAKQRLFNTVIGLVAWVVMFSVVNWLIPGTVPDPENPSSPIQAQDRNDTNPIEGGGAVGGKDDDGDDEKDWDSMTCNEKRQTLLDEGYPMGEVRAMLKEEGC